MDDCDVVNMLTSKVLLKVRMELVDKNCDNTVSLNELLNIELNLVVLIMLKLYKPLQVEMLLC